MHMAHVLLVPPSPGPGGYDALEADYRIVATSASGASTVHKLATDPEQADVILYVGTRAPLHRDVRHHPWAREYPRKVVVYDSGDWLIPFFPGIYPSIPPKFHDPHRTCGGHYLRYSDSSAIRYTDPNTKPTLLFGFRGAMATHPIRQRLLDLAGPDSDIVDTSAAPGRGYGQAASVYEDYKDEYGQSLARAKYILCPRGAGPSSMRIFEAMKAGRVPVIISDAWVAPPGPDWSTFSLRLLERDIANLRSILRSDQQSAPERGRRAKRAWDEHYSPQACFATLASQALSVLPHRWGRERCRRAMAHVRLLSRPALRHAWPARVLRRWRTTAWTA